MKIKRIGVVALLIVIAFAFVAHRAESKKYNSYEYIYYTVKPTDTSVWQIVDRQYGDKVDIRKMVREVERMSNVENHLIHTGDLLLLPDIK